MVYYKKSQNIFQKVIYINLIKNKNGKESCELGKKLKEKAG